MQDFEVENRIRIIIKMLKKQIWPALLSVSLGVIVALVAIFFVSERFSRPSEVNAPSSYAQAVAKAMPSVVNIYTRTHIQREHHPLYSDPMFKHFFGNDSNSESKSQSNLGSGVIMGSQGQIITNYHVIRGADEIVVALNDGREANAQVVGADEATDLAVLKINLNNLPMLKIANDQAMRIGDVVLAIGNPFGVGQAVTMGIVSATGRNRIGLNLYENYIQTDAAINPGNSGGALVNAQGQLVGINTAIYSKSGAYQGIGFAIPAMAAHKIMQDIIKNGRVIRGWLGVEVREITPQFLRNYQLPDSLKGLWITSLDANGPADKAGLSLGDVIVKINEQAADNARTVMYQIARIKPGENIRIDFIRNGRRLYTQAKAASKTP